MITSTINEYADIKILESIFISLIENWFGVDEVIFQAWKIKHSIHLDNSI